jgi:hypothetical protein
MTRLDEHRATDAPEPGSAEHSSPTLGDRLADYVEHHPNSKRAAALRRLRALERRAVDLPIVGKIHAPDKHDAVYLVGLGSLLAVGAVELPIVLILLGGHAMVRQHQSRSLSALGEVIEDVWGHGV